MIQPIKTGVAAMALLLAISCKKENNSIGYIPATNKSSTESLLRDVDEPDTTIVSIQIGIQKWMTKYLHTSHYRNGDRIPEVRGAA